MQTDPFYMKSKYYFIQKLFISLHYSKFLFFDYMMTMQSATVFKNRELWKIYGKCVCSERNFYLQSQSLQQEINTILKIDVATLHLDFMMS